MHSLCSASIRQILVRDFGTAASLQTLSFGVVMEEILRTLTGVHEAVCLRRARKVGIPLTLFGYAKTAVEGSFGSDFADFPASRGSHLQEGRSPYWVEHLKRRVEAGLHAHCSRKLTGLKQAHPNWKQNSMI